MASIKISELEEVTELSTSDVLPIINENKTKKVSLEKLNEILGGSGSGSAKMLIIEFDNNLRTFDTDTNKAILTEYYNSIRNDEFVELFIGFNKFGSYESGDSPYKYRATVMIIDDYSLNLYCPLHSNTGQSQNVYGVNYHQMKELEISAAVQTSGGNYNITSITHSYSSSLSLNSNNKILGINNTTAFTPTGDYNPATKKYVDDAVANINTPGGDTTDVTSGLVVIHASGYLPTSSSVQFNTDAQKEPFLQAFKATNGDSSKIPVFLIIFADGSILFNKTSTSYVTNAYRTIYYRGEVFDKNNNTNIRTSYSFSVDVNGLGYGNDEISIRSSTISISRSKIHQVLDVDNTTAFTPTGDYNPATKKYVDDAVKNAITSVLEAGY